MIRAALTFTAIILLTFFSLTAQAQTNDAMYAQQLRDAVNLANASPGEQIVVNIVGADPMAVGNIDVFEAFGESDNAMPVLTGNLKIQGGYLTGHRAEGTAFRLFEVAEGGQLELNNVLGISGFGGVNNGGVVLATDGSSIKTNHVQFNNNSALQDGGVIAVVGNNTRVHLSEDTYRSNSAGGLGGAVSIIGMDGAATITWALFAGNQAGPFGCSINIDTNNAIGMEVILSENTFSGACANRHIENASGAMKLSHNTFGGSEGFIDSTAIIARLLGNILDSGNTPQQNMQALVPIPKSQLEDNCRDFGSGAFASLGYNISSDDTCDLDQPTDLPNTDPLIEENADGFLVPQPGSPAIDGGSDEVIRLVDDGPAELPCNYRDSQGTARPQDANDDGIFECDVGAIELPGTGEVVAGHSSVFFNPERNGEGNYVEILDNGRAIVYTFTYNPEGDGPAWFIGGGEYAGNSIILDDLFRPIGTTFGDDFNAADIELTPAGSMSMVFPDCEAAAPGGNIAFTGDDDLGFEGLITRASRLAHITGCGAETPGPNAGLSGTFYDPARNGEGLIVEWITNGDVLVVFFTYDPDGKQFWLVGQGTANGKSVTMTAWYPTEFTPWGGDFNADDIVLSTWGTFTLTWTDCDTLTFNYNSTVPRFGMATRNYTRLSNLAGTNCPAFP